MNELLTLETHGHRRRLDLDPGDGSLEAGLGFFMVPLKVHFGDQMFRDGIDMTYKEFFAKLEQSEVLRPRLNPPPVSSSPPTREALNTTSTSSPCTSGRNDERDGPRGGAGGTAVRQRLRLDLRTVTSACRWAPSGCVPASATGCTLDEAHAWYRRHFRDHSQLSVHAATSSTCVAAAGSGSPPRSSAGCSTSSRSSPRRRHADRLRQGARVRGAGDDAAIRRGAQ